MRRQESGQAQILIALAMSTVMISAAYYTLERTQKAGETAIRQMKLSEARAALDGAIQFAAYLYQFQSGCDPVLFNEKLSRLNLDGSLLESGTSSPTIRQMDVSVNFTAFRIAFGPVTRIDWVGSTDDPSVPNEVGTSQDALIETWTTSQSTRFIQRAVLINNCTYPCSTSLSSSGYCVAASDAAIAYHQIDPHSFPIPSCGGTGSTGVAGGAIGGTSSYGIVDSLDQVINVPDLIVLRNYLRSGQTEGSVGEFVIKECADVNQDGMLNEIDLNLIEKLLRGYINYIPVYEP